MEWFNPVECLAWVYGKFFYGHSGGKILGGSLVVVCFAAVGSAIWMRAVDKYDEDHPPKQQAVEKAPTPKVSTAEQVPIAPPQRKTPIAPPTRKVRDKREEQPKLPESGIIADNSRHEKIENNFLYGKAVASARGAQDGSISGNVVINPPDTSDKELPFADIKVGESTWGSMVMTYMHQFPTKVLCCQLYGEDAGDFSFESTCKNEQPIKFRDSCNLKINFEPKSPGEKHAILSLTFVGDPAMTVVLTGRSKTSEDSVPPP